MTHCCCDGPAFARRTNPTYWVVCKPLRSRKAKRQGKDYIRELSWTTQQKKGHQDGLVAITKNRSWMYGSLQTHSGLGSYLNNVLSPAKERTHHSPSAPFASLIVFCKWTVWIQAKDSKSCEVTFIYCSHLPLVVSYFECGAIPASETPL